MQELRITRKWRPPLWLVIGALVLVLVILPIAGLVFARLAENQFVRETERSLIAQAAIFAEVYSEALRAVTDEEIGTPMPDAAKARREPRYYPVDPQLDADDSMIGEVVPEGRVLAHPPLPAYATVTAQLGALAVLAQKTTLASYRFTDEAGQIIASSGAGVGTSLAHLPEIRSALSGEVASVLRYREPREERHALASISRDTGFRVHVTAPVVVGDRIAGAVQVSRTPVNLRKFLYNERFLLGQMALVMIAGAALLGFVFWRFISRPIRALRTQSHEVASGLKPAPEPLAHYGVSELAELGQSVLSMARTLTERGDALRTYTDHVTHELKSPVTAIVGAAEILETSGGRMEEKRRARLLATIHAEGLRMDALLEKLRELARVRMLEDQGDTALVDAAQPLSDTFTDLAVIVDVPEDFRVPVSHEALDILLTQLLKNAHDHGATEVHISKEFNRQAFTLRDNGQGIAEANKSKIFEPFFTTKRSIGGTGMGLNIISALVHRSGGTISLEHSESGAAFCVAFDA